MNPNESSNISATNSLVKIQNLSTHLISDYLNERRDIMQATREIVSVITSEVRSKGFAAVARYSKELDDFTLTSENLRCTGYEMKKAEQSLSTEERQAILAMKERIVGFAEVQKKALTKIVQRTVEGKTTLVFRPVQRVGIYVPGGRAPLLSSLFMAAIPAFTAGVKEVIVCTPPQKDGSFNRYILAACQLCGIEGVYKIGGAQAIGAMAFGIPGQFEPVEVIAGPGNAFVSAAKQEVMSMSGVRIDVPAGPSEVVVIADHTSSPAFVAADMLAQAEHGFDSAAICLCTRRQIAEDVVRELSKQLNALPDENMARKSIPRWGKVFVTRNLKSAIEAANTLAPEHLELMVKNSFRFVSKVKNAGAVFVNTAESFCDYGMSGGNHILPTGGTAKSWSGVTLQTFIKWIYIDELFPEAQKSLASSTAKLARMEGLEAHARAAEQRIYP